MCRLRVEVGSGHHDLLSVGPWDSPTYQVESRALALLASHAELALATAEARIQDDLGADLQGVHLWTQRRNDSCRIGADDLSLSRWVRRMVGSSVEIQVVQRGRSNLEEGLTRPWDGVGESLDRHHGP